MPTRRWDLQMRAKAEVSLFSSPGESSPVVRPSWQMPALIAAALREVVCVYYFRLSSSACKVDSMSFSVWAAEIEHCFVSIGKK